MRRVTLAFLSVVVASTACDLFGPSARVEHRIYDIRVPQHAAAGDSVRIVFLTDVGPCDTGELIDSRATNGVVRFVVSTDRPESSARPCAAALAVIVDRVYYLPPPHAGGIVIQFAEPGQKDSVRVVLVP